LLARGVVAVRRVGSAASVTSTTREVVAGA